MLHGSGGPARGKKVVGRAKRLPYEVEKRWGGEVEIEGTLFEARS